MYCCLMHQSCLCIRSLTSLVFESCRSISLVHRLLRKPTREACTGDTSGHRDAVLVNGRDVEAEQEAIVNRKVLPLLFGEVIRVTASISRERVEQKDSYV